MSEHDPYENLAEEHERYRAHLIATFGPDITIGLATDQGPTGGSTIAREVAQDRRRQYLDRRQAEIQDINQRAAAEEAKRAAYERVHGGGQATDQDQRLAAQYAIENGIVQPKSTTTRLIEQGRRRSA